MKRSVFDVLLLFSATWCPSCKVTLEVAKSVDGIIVYSDVGPLSEKDLEEALQKIIG